MDGYEGLGVASDEAPATAVEPLRVSPVPDGIGNAEKPMTATAMMMRDERLEVRDRAVSISIGREMADRVFYPDHIGNMDDVRRQITQAAELAAYTAIQKERELHAGDMEMIKAYWEMKTSELLNSPQPIMVRPDTSQ